MDVDPILQAVAPQELSTHIHRQCSGNSITIAPLSPLPQSSHPLQQQQLQHPDSAHLHQQGCRAADTGAPPRRVVQPLVPASPPLSPPSCIVTMADPPHTTTLTSTTTPAATKTPSPTPSFTDQNGRPKPSPHHHHQQHQHHQNLRHPALHTDTRALPAWQEDAQVAEASDGAHDSSLSSAYTSGSSPSSSSNSSNSSAASSMLPSPTSISRSSSTFLHRQRRPPGEQEQGPAQQQRQQHAQQPAASHTETTTTATTTTATAATTSDTSNALHQSPQPPPVVEAHAFRGHIYHQAPMQPHMPLQDRPALARVPIGQHPFVGTAAIPTSFGRQHCDRLASQVYRHQHHHIHHHHMVQAQQHQPFAEVPDDVRDHQQQHQHQHQHHQQHQHQPHHQGNSVLFPVATTAAMPGDRLPDFNTHHPHYLDGHPAPGMPPSSLSSMGLPFGVTAAAAAPTWSAMPRMHPFELQHPMCDQSLLHHHHRHHTLSVTDALGFARADDPIALPGSTGMHPAHDHALPLDTHMQHVPAVDLPSASAMTGGRKESEGVPDTDDSGDEGDVDDSGSDADETATTHPSARRKHARRNKSRVPQRATGTNTHKRGAKATQQRRASARRTASCSADTPSAINNTNHTDRTSSNHHTTTNTSTNNNNSKRSKSVSCSMAVKEEAECGPVLNVKEARELMCEVDRRLSLFGLRSQKQKAAFLTQLGVVISQQHYSSILSSTQTNRWFGGPKASHKVIRMHAAVFDITEEERVRVAAQVAEMQTEMRRRRSSSSSSSGGRRASSGQPNMASPFPPAAVPNLLHIHPHFAANMSTDTVACPQHAPTTASDNVATKPKRPRKMPPDVSKQLREYFFRVNRRPTRSDKEALLRQFPMLSLKQLNIYFQNMRARNKSHSEHTPQSPPTSW
ncbi:hypothetical protein PTSG_09736 [Salpingoeca rosetta]|uniref:Homeobox domain-containing protein n=1 Tax=Salpingoeca rosetta (strain ATCC 50818 / BSB-021) TaxID=946362 RepID=F2UNW7_SALR5|nr:uncharacterized protein PTSG_09736 [Salpingoeca rosetta]EGD79322.1 hypothetical protein PTSG_09736 [Salpingoeca rosetta]|eukprot:XP_004989091.1 hypothetical protein PTSG_09736 [Salpingoeca rosetta]